MSRILSALSVSATFVAACTPTAETDTQADSAEDVAEVSRDGGPGSDVDGSEREGIDPATLYYCGDGFCGPGEGVTTCPEDCKSGYTVTLNPVLYLQDEEVSANLACGSEERTGWHYGGVGGEGSLPFSVFGSDCGINDVAAERLWLYGGFTARWTIEVTRAAEYRIKAWIPGADDGCLSASPVCAEVYYFLHGPKGFIKGRLAHQVAFEGEAMVLWDAVQLPEGTFTLSMPDGAGGCACGPTEECDGEGPSCRVFADHVFFERL